VECINIYDRSELPEIENGYRYLDFIGGEKNYQYFIVPYDMPRSEFIMKYSSLLDECLEPIYQKNGIVISQDASYPLPGFYILSYENHFKAIDYLDDITHLRTFFLLKRIREGMRKRLGIEYIHMYHEEKSEKSCNVHYWLMPVQDRDTFKTPIIYDLDIRSYLERFEFSKERETILKYNSLMKKYISEIDLSGQDESLSKKMTCVEKYEYKE
jgi:hypothetical protein